MAMARAAKIAHARRTVTNAKLPAHRPARTPREFAQAIDISGARRGRFDRLPVRGFRPWPGTGGAECRRARPRFVSRVGDNGLLVLLVWRCTVHGGLPERGKTRRHARPFVSHRFA